MRKSRLLVCGASLCGCLVCVLLSTSGPAAAAGLYLVEPGDTLFKISRLFEVDVASIVEENHLASDALTVGDRLRIPDLPARPAPVADPAPRNPVTTERVLQAVCREEKVYHSVAKGDTLSSIAGRYDTEVDNLLRLNGLRKRDRLAIGQKILVRKSGPRSHTVARGETLTRIARRYGTEVDEIARLNHLEQYAIAPGQRLLIEPCDPVAVAGSAPPPLDGRDLSPLQAGGAVAAVAEPGAAVADRVITVARTMLNVPYRFGGNTLRGIDCSAYVQRVFGLLEVPLPRTAREQYGVGAHIDRDELRVGDLVFFRTYASYPSHVGIYLGDDRFIHASSMVRRVAIDSIDQPYYRKRFIGARRLVVDGAPAVASTP